MSEICEWQVNPESQGILQIPYGPGIIWQSLIPLYNTNEYPSVMMDTLPIGRKCDSCDVKEYFSMIADNVQVLSNAQVLIDRGPRKDHINKRHSAKYP